MKKGKYKVAIDHFNEALRIDPAHPDVPKKRDEAVRLHAGVYYRLGEEFVKRGEYKVAIDYYNEALKIDPKHVEAPKRHDVARRLHAGMYYQRGVEFLNQDAFDVAIDYFKRAMDLDRNYPGALLKQAECYCQRGEAREKRAEIGGAILDYKEAIKLCRDDPASARPYIRLANLLIHHANATVEAIKCAKTAIRLLGSQINADAYEVLAAAHNRRIMELLSQGDYGASSDQFKDALKSISAYPDAQKHLTEAQKGLSKFEYGNGMESLRTDKFDAAIAWFKKAIETDPSSDEANQKLAGTFYSKGLDSLARKNYKEALDCFTEALDRGYLVATARLAETYYERHGPRMEAKIFPGPRRT